MKLGSNKSKGFAGVLVLILIVLLGFLGYLYLTKVKAPVSLNTGSNSGPVVTPDTYSDPNIVKTADGGQRVTFSYKVKSISPSQIVITGKMGDMTLPNDPSAIQLFNGPTKESPKLELASLKVGDDVNLEFKPGESASLFLSTM